MKNQLKLNGKLLIVGGLVSLIVVLSLVGIRTSGSSAVSNANTKQCEIIQNNGDIKTIKSVFEGIMRNGEGMNVFVFKDNLMRPVPVKVDSMETLNKLVLEKPVVKEESCREKKEESGEEKKEETSQDKKEVSGQENKEEASQENKEVSDQENKEMKSQEKKEVPNQENKEEASQENKEVSGQEKKEEISQEKKEESGQEKKEETSQEKKEMSVQEKKEEFGLEKKEMKSQNKEEKREKEEEFVQNNENEKKTESANQQSGENDKKKEQVNNENLENLVFVEIGEAHPNQIRINYRPLASEELVDVNSWVAKFYIMTGGYSLPKTISEISESLQEMKQCESHGYPGVAFLKNCGYLFFYNSKDKKVERIQKFVGLDEKVDPLDVFCCLLKIGPDVKDSVHNSANATDSRTEANSSVIREISEKGVKQQTSETLNEAISTVTKDEAIPSETSNKNIPSVIQNETVPSVTQNVTIKSAQDEVISPAAQNELV